MVFGRFPPRPRFPWEREDAGSQTRIAVSLADHIADELIRELRRLGVNEVQLSTVAHMVASDLGVAINEKLPD